MEMRKKYNVKDVSSLHILLMQSFIFIVHLIAYELEIKFHRQYVFFILASFVETLAETKKLIFNFN